ncbi:MAG: GAF domain-containing protein, partial [Anaerolineales bacterium]|nr:GAF domain-containing protein [Anaerolineales bacterium]
AFLLWVALGDKTISRRARRLAWGLCFANLLVASISIALQGIAQFPVATILASALFVAAYSYAGFQGMIGVAGRPSEQRLQTGSLSARLTALTVIVSAPLLVAMSLFLTDRARLQIERDALQSLSAANHTLANTTSLWLDFNLKALENLARDPTIASMDPALQKPLLESMAATYAHMYLISTTDTSGINVARNDDEAPKDYSDRAWVQGALSGAEVTYQTLIGRTSNQPALVVSKPIRDPNGAIIGVGMFASTLDEISLLVARSELGQGGFTYVVDQQNLVIAHPQPAQAMQDMSQAPPVVALRQGQAGPISFTDENGQLWRADFSLLPNGWGVVAQQPEAQLLAPIRAFQGMALAATLIGLILLVVMAYSSTRQSLRPIQSLTVTAAAIQAGDMTRLAPVESQDELGLLAETFNAMAAQVRELVSGLERRVAERTQALEQRALQLQVTAEVAREAAAIRDLEQLLDKVVHLISDRFGFYHAGIFLLSGDEGEAAAPSGYAVLRAASSQGGQRMLARGHRLRVGRVGIVGYVAAAGHPRIALDVGEDAVFFDNPDLPETRSEMALPLMVQERVIGVLDVQSRQPAAFSEEDITILQILADQVTLAIENARLLQESRQALRELQLRYGRQIQQGWQARLAVQPLTFTYDAGGVKRGLPGEQAVVQQQGDGQNSALPDIYLPIELRGQRLGYLRLRRPPDAGPWTPEERELLRGTLDQLALSLENARLLEEVRDRARQEELINQIISRAQSSLNLEAVMKTTVQEVGRMMNLSGLSLRLEQAPVTRPSPASSGIPFEPGQPPSEESTHRVEP